jgi:hypothetical protein
MQIITRFKFPDVSLDAETIAGWFEAWLGWRMIFLRSNLAASRPDGVFRIDGFVAGYPEKELAARASDWSARLPKERFRAAQIKDDGVLLRSTVQPIGQHELAEILGALFCEPAEAMAMRFELVTWDGGAEDSVVPQEALVLYGVMRDGAFVLKGLWPKALPHDDGSLYQAAAWPEQERALRAFGIFSEVRARLQTTAEDRGKLSHSAETYEEAASAAIALRKLTGKEVEFEPGDVTLRADVTATQMALAASYGAAGNGISSVFSPAVVRQAALLVKILFGSGQLKENIWEFAKRAGGLLGATSVFAALCTLSALGKLRFFIVQAAIVCGIGFLIAAGWKAYIIYMFRTQMRKGLGKVYSAPWEGTEILAPDERFWNQPTFRKLSADAEAAGGRHFIDLMMKNTGTMNVARVYFFADIKTYLFINFILENQDGGKSFPVQATLLARTIFADGVVVATVDQGLGFKKRLDKRSCRKLFMGVTGVADMLARHRKTLAKFQTTARGPLEFTKEEFIANEKSEHVVSSERNRKYGYYRWTDAVGEVFGLLRSDLVERE